MFKDFISINLKRGWSLVMAVGLAAFVVSFGALIIFGTGWAAAIILSISGTVLTAVIAALVALLAMSLAGGLIARQLRRENEQMRTAIDSMAQGLCMFDASERLVVCNAQYF